MACLVLSLLSSTEAWLDRAVRAQEDAHAGMVSVQPHASMGLAHIDNSATLGSVLRGTHFGFQTQPACAA